MLDKSCDYMTDTLQKMHKIHVSIKQKERKATNATLATSLAIILEEMIKCDADFRRLQPRIAQYFGDFFESLAIDRPEPIPVYLEFSIFLKDFKKAVALKTNGQYTTVTASNVKSEVFVGKQLSHVKLKNLIRTALEKSKLTIRNRFEQKKLDIKFSIIEKADDYYLKVNNIRFDLVPVVSMLMSKKPKNCQIDFEMARHLGPEYFLFPAKDYDQFHFVVELAQQEKRFMKSKYHLKFVLRILKLILIGQQIPLTDYCIKTLFMLEIHHQSKTFWIFNSKGFLLLHVLKVLRQHFEEGAMHCIWDDKNNLLRQYESDALKLWALKLDLIVGRIQSRQPIEELFLEN